MGASLLSPASAKTRYAVTLLSGTSWTVPTGCLYVNAKLIGGGGGGGTGSSHPNRGAYGAPGQIIVTNVATTPGSSITYGIGAGGVANTAGGNTTFTGATTANGGAGAPGYAGPTPAGIGQTAGNQGGDGGDAGNAGSAGGQGLIELEYWV